MNHPSGYPGKKIPIPNDNEIPTEKRSTPNLDRSKDPKRRSKYLKKYPTPGFGIVIRGLETDPPAFPELDLIPFEISRDADTTTIREPARVLLSVPEFKMTREDFPALPISQNKTECGFRTAVDPQRRRGVQTHPDGRTINVPGTTSRDRYGGLELQGLGEDLTKLGYDLNSKDFLHTSFNTPFADFKPQPQDIDYEVPEEYLHHRKTKKKLPAVDFSRYNDDTLFYLFYTFVGDYKQLMAAAYLYDKKWRFHKEENCWICLVVDQKNTYCFFDPAKWCKIRVIDHQMDFSKLAERPHVPNVSPALKPEVQHNLNPVTVLPTATNPRPPPYPVLHPPRQTLPIFTPCPPIRNPVPVAPFTRFMQGYNPPRNLVFTTSRPISTNGGNLDRTRRKKRY